MIALPIVVDVEVGFQIYTEDLKTKIAYLEAESGMTEFFG